MARAFAGISPGDHSTVRGTQGQAHNQGGGPLRRQGARHGGLRPLIRRQTDPDLYSQSQRQAGYSGRVVNTAAFRGQHTRAATFDVLPPGTNAVSQAAPSQSYQPYRDEFRLNHMDRSPTDPKKSRNSPLKGPYYTPPHQRTNFIDHGQPGVFQGNSSAGFPYQNSGATMEASGPTAGEWAFMKGFSSGQSGRSRRALSRYSSTASMATHVSKGYEVSPLSSPAPSRQISHRSQGSRNSGLRLSKY